MAPTDCTTKLKTSKPVLLLVTDPSSRVILSDSLINSGEISLRFSSLKPNEFTSFPSISAVKETGCSAENLSRMPVCLGLKGEDFGIVEVTRCVGNQIFLLGNPEISEVWLTHAHLGHIEGLGQFGKEAFNSKNIKLRCSSSVVDYVMKHPIWKKLIERGNFTFDKFQTDRIVPIEVSHISNDFYSHDIFFKGENNKILFLPDQYNWDKTLYFVCY